MIGDTIYFVLDDPRTGREIYVTRSQQTPELLIDTIPGPGSGNVDHVFATEGGFLFTALDANDLTKRQVWVSDGTPEGTRVIDGTLPESVDVISSDSGAVVFEYVVDQHQTIFYFADGMLKPLHGVGQADNPRWVHSLQVGRKYVFFHQDGHEYIANVATGQVSLVVGENGRFENGIQLETEDGIVLRTVEQKLLFFHSNGTSTVLSEERSIVIGLRSGLLYFYVPFPESSPPTIMQTDGTL
ncbi:MAG: hypothetical protein AAFP90_10065, partial [Planctomycetota bacterium]